MDFLTKKELSGLKYDLQSTQAALDTEKESFQKRLNEIYGEEIEKVLNRQFNNKMPVEKEKRKFSLKNLFSIARHKNI